MLPGNKFKVRVEWPDPADLTPYDRNAKQHPDGQVDAIARLIRATISISPSSSTRTIGLERARAVLGGVASTGDRGIGRVTDVRRPGGWRWMRRCSRAGDRRSD